MHPRLTPDQEGISLSRNLVILAHQPAVNIYVEVLVCLCKEKTATGVLRKPRLVVIVTITSQ